MFLFFEFGIIGVMYVWFRARKIKSRYVEFVRLNDYLPLLKELSNDKSIPKYATHLVYLTSSENPKEVEHKIIYSILSGKPKRADFYWFVHIHTLDNPYTSEYTFKEIIPNEVFIVELRLGFRVQPRTNLMFRKIVEEMANNGKIKVESKYETMQNLNPVGDIQFIVMEKFLSHDNELPLIERMVMKFHFWIKDRSLSEEKGFGLDQSNVTVEKFPLIVAPLSKIALKQV